MNVSGKECRNQTVQTIVHETKDSEEAEISLGSIIDRLEPCNWNFQVNLILALKAINGDLHPDKPFAAHKLRTFTYDGHAQKSLNLVLIMGRTDKRK